jgi:hypothetical protein
MAQDMDRNFETENWENIVKSPSARWMATMTPIKGGTELFLFGGCGESGGPLDDAWRYKVKEKKWELVST